MKPQKLLSLVLLITFAFGAAGSLAKPKADLQENEYQMTPGEALHVHSDSGLSVTQEGSQDVTILSDELPTSTPTATDTPTETPTHTPTSTATIAPTSAATVTPSQTANPITPSPTTPSQGNQPFLSAPLCLDSGASHNNSLFHTLWDGVRGCHYDHEHGQNPFTPEVAAMFPGFDLRALIGGVGVGHTNPSSEMENTHKHGGFDWNVQLKYPNQSAVTNQCGGFEGAATGGDGSVIQFHGFGDYAIEAEARIHSTVALLRQCRSSNPTDYGYLFINQLQDYGQRVSPYQGDVNTGVMLPYPNQPVPAYDTRGGPYLSFLCIDLVSPFDSHCRAGLQQAQNNNAQSTWTSKPTHGGHSDSSPRFKILWRVRDTYREIHMDNWPFATYPFEFLWLCTSDGGATFNPAGCRYNNTTTQVQEIAGTIPNTWDNLAGWDSNPTVGRITAQGFLDFSGNINPDCTAPGQNCFPIKMVNVFTGTYGSVLVFSFGKGTNVVSSLPERDIYFCGTVVCSETSPGAVPSGWIGQNN